MNDSRIGNARRLRREATPAERKLWSILRGGGLEGYKFRRQVPIDRYFADFCCMQARLIVEVDGGQHADVREYDAERTRTLESLGFTVLRFWNSAVLREPDGVVLSILAALKPTRPEDHTW